MQPSPSTVWLLFRRRTFSRLAYWFLALGYNFRDRSWSNRFYLIYFCSFWLTWILAVFAMLGSALADVFRFLPVTALAPAFVILLWTFILLAWGTMQLWQVTKRSPFVFGEPDAYLLCQTPVRRPIVALAWFLIDWFGTVLPFAAGTILFSFALVETALPHAVGFGDILAYFAASLRALLIILPLQMGLQAGMWGIGALRLRRDRALEHWRWFHLFVLFLGLSLLFIVFLPGWRTIILAPLTFLLDAAFSQTLPQSAWLIGFGLGLLVLVSGMASLLVWSDRMHLGRAAQETRLLSSIRIAREAMNFELADIIIRQSRIKATRPTNRLPVRNGAWMLVWKNVIQSWRSLRTGQVLRWLWVFFLGVGIFISPTWKAQLITGAIWAVVLGSLITDRLCSDLTRWWILRSLPLKDSSLLLAELGPACGLGLILVWLALALSSSISSFSWLEVLLFPFLVASAAFGSASDILEHAKKRVLMAPGLVDENVPGQDVQGIFVITISVGIPLGLLIWGKSGGFIWALLSLPIAVLITFLNFRAVLSAYR